MYGSLELFALKMESNCRFMLLEKSVYRFWGLGGVNLGKNVLLPRKLSLKNTDDSRAFKSRISICFNIHSLTHESRSRIFPPPPSFISNLNLFQYKNEPGYEDYDKTSTPSPPTPVSTPPITNAITSTTLTGLPQLHPPHHPPPRRSLGSNVDAKNYIHKIRHETIRISVIERLEGYLKIGVEETTPTPVVPCAKDQCEDEDEDEDQQTRSGTPVEPEVGMWVDHCKRLFLWYYDIYMVRFHSIAPVFSSFP